MNDAVRQIGPVAITVATLDEATAWIGSAVKLGTSGIWAFCNAHTVNVARRDPALRAALARATVFNDGLGVDLASRLLYGAPFPDNLNGTDLTPALLSRLPEGTPVFLIGSEPGVAELAGHCLAQTFPGIRFVGSHHGFFAEADEPMITAQIRASGARLVLVGMGNPAQEFWAMRNTSEIAAPLLCIGAFLDFAAGRVSRAPGFVRKVRLEWVYRLLLEPRRLARRYLIGNVSFLAAVLRQRAFG